MRDHIVAHCRQNYARLFSMDIRSLPLKSAPKPARNPKMPKRAPYPHPPTYIYILYVYSSSISPIFRVCLGGELGNYREPNDSLAIAAANHWRSQEAARTVASKSACPADVRGGGEFEYN